MTRPTLPKALREPATGWTVETEPEDVKAIRLLRGLRHFARSKHGTLGMTLDGVQILLIKYRPQPAGPHVPGADLEGTAL